MTNQIGLRSSALHAIHTFFDNQKGAAFCASILLLVAAVWTPALWIVRESYPYTLHVALGGSLVSWLLVRWALRRPGLNNSLVGTLEETRTFFAMLSLSFGAFFLLYLWRFGTSDPLATSHTLLQIESERDRIQNGEVVAFLKAPRWKLALAIAAFLVLFTRANALRKAIRGTSKRAPRIVRAIRRMSQCAGPCQ